MSAFGSRVAIVMITYNRRDEALRSLGRLSSLVERPSIIVVDNRSTDGSGTAIARRFPSVEVITADRNLGGAARNLGVRRSACPYIAFCDDDSWWAPGSLRRAAEILDEYPRLGVMSARILVEPGGQEAPICRELGASPLSSIAGMPGIPLLGFIAGASVVRRSAFLEAGGFEERLLIGGEEELLALDLAALGWQIGYFPELVSHHAPSLTRNVGQRNSRTIRNQLWVSWLRHPRRRAWRRTLEAVRAAGKDRTAAKGLAAALASFPWALWHRRVIPPEIERELRLLGVQESTAFSATM
jgi:GT2 family glycosyltransferase